MSRLLDANSQWLTLSQASHRLGIHPTTLREWVDAKIIPSFRTPGGHRRFDARDIEKFLQRQTTMPHAQAALPAMPLNDVRQHLDVNQMAQQPWYHQLSQAQRAHERETGQRMLGLLIQYSSRKENVQHFLDEARSIVRSYGHEFAQANMSVSDVVRAFLFIRKGILNSIYPPEKLSAMNDLESLPLYIRVNGFLDELLLSIFDAYEHARLIPPVKQIALRKPVKRKRK